MQARIVRGLTIAMITLSATAIAAEAGESIVRFGGATVEPVADLKLLETETVFIPPEPLPITLRRVTTIEAKGNAGLFVSFERRIGDTIGLELAVAHSKHVVDYHTVESLFLSTTGEPLGIASDELMRGDIDLMPVTLGMNVYLDNRDSVDFYVGPFLGFVFYGDLAVPDLPAPAKSVGEFPTVDVAVKDDFAFGGVIGIGLPIGEKWVFRSSVRYLKTEADVLLEEGGVLQRKELAIHPVSAELTFGVRF